MRDRPSTPTAAQVMGGHHPSLKRPRIATRCQDREGSQALRVTRHCFLFSPLAIEVEYVRAGDLAPSERWLIEMRNTWRERGGTGDDGPAPEEEVA